MAFPPVDRTLSIEIIESRTDKCQYKCKHKVCDVIKPTLIAAPGIAFVLRTICGIEGHGDGLGQARMTIALAGPYDVQ